MSARKGTAHARSARGWATAPDTATLMRAAASRQREHAGLEHHRAKKNT